MTNEVQIHLKIFIIIAPFGRNRVPESRMDGYENEMTMRVESYINNMFIKPPFPAYGYIFPNTFSIT